jgi:predicted restriction endonuclease
MSLLFSYYKSVVLTIHRGIAHGSPSNAKPLLLLAIIKGIEDGNIIGNKIEFNESINNDYQTLCSFFEPTKKPAPLFKPFYHSEREEYYNLKWKDGDLPIHKWHTPSAKFLREHLDYAYLNDGLWEILQSQAARKEFQELIIDNYLNPTTVPTI